MKLSTIYVVYQYKRKINFCTKGAGAKYEFSSIYFYANSFFLIKEYLGFYNLYYLTFVAGMPQTVL